MCTIMTSTPLRPTVYSGNFINCISISEIEVLENALVGVDEEGDICFIVTEPHTKGRSVKEVVDEWGWDVRFGDENGEWDLVESGAHGRSWFFPGFIGT